jgi:hypothetical protein
VLAVRPSDLPATYLAAESTAAAKELPSARYLHRASKPHTFISDVDQDQTNALNYDTQTIISSTPYCTTLTLINNFICVFTVQAILQYSTPCFNIVNRIS